MKIIPHDEKLPLDDTNRDPVTIDATHVSAKKDVRALSMDDIEAAQALETLRAGNAPRPLHSCLAKKEQIHNRNGPPTRSP